MTATTPVPSGQEANAEEGQSKAAQQERVGAGFWISAAGGWAIIGIGLRGVFAHSLDTRPANLAKFVVGGALLHDLVVAPIVIVIGAAVAKTVKGPSRAVVQAALAATAILALFSYPFVRSFGRATHNPSSLPHNYAHGLLLVLSVVWTVAAIILLRRLKRAHA